MWRQTLLHAVVSRVWYEVSRTLHLDCCNTVWVNSQDGSEVLSSAHFTSGLLATANMHRTKYLFAKTTIKCRVDWHTVPQWIGCSIWHRMVGMYQISVNVMFLKSTLMYFYAIIVPACRSVLCHLFSPWHPVQNNTRSTSFFHNQCRCLWVRHIHITLIRSNQSDWFLNGPYTAASLTAYPSRSRVPPSCCSIRQCNWKRSMQNNISRMHPVSAMQTTATKFTMATFFIQRIIPYWKSSKRFSDNPKFLHLTDSFSKRVHEACWEMQTLK